MNTSNGVSKSLNLKPYLPKWDINWHPNQHWIEVSQIDLKRQRLIASWFGRHDDDIFQINLKTGKTVLISQGIFGGMSPDGSSCLIYTRDLIPQMCRGGPAKIYDLDSGKQTKITGEFSTTSGAVWQ